MRWAALLVLPVAVAAGGTTAALPGIPRDVQPYRSWARLNSKPIPPRANDPHRSTKNVYASKLPRNGRYPVGALVVKEGRNGGFVSLIAIMRKTRAAAHNGWVMIEWTRPSARARFTRLAQGAVCTGCHMQARRTDYVFTRRR